MSQSLNVVLSLGFKKEKSFEERLQEAKRIKRIYADSVPIIVEKHPQANIPNLARKKFIVPKKRTLSDFNCLLRRKIQLQETQALFLMIKDFSPNLTSTVLEVYQVNRHH